MQNTIPDSKSLLKRYRDGNFKSVEGWGMNDPRLIDLFSVLNDFQLLHDIKGPLCEIGVHHGRTLILLGLLKRSNEKVFGIDLFESVQEQNLDSSGKGSHAVASQNLLIHAPGVTFDLITANSFDLSLEQRAMLKGTRFLHIDGGHFVELVLNDLALAQSVLGTGGIIVIDDFWHSGYPEVQEAVHRYFSTATAIKATPFMTGANKLFLTHFSHRDRLIEFVAPRIPEGRGKPVRIPGYHTICIDAHL